MVVTRRVCDDCGNVPMQTMGKCADCDCDLCDVCLHDAALTGYPGLCEDCANFTASTDKLKEDRPGEYADDEDLDDEDLDDEDLDDEETGP